MGGNYETCRLTNQEYFERLHADPEKWGKPMQALLGLIEAEMAFETPAIGGKDSMSGTFNDISVDVYKRQSFRCVDILPFACRFSMTEAIKSISSLIPGARPSITQPMASPWLSPKIVTE